VDNDLALKIYIKARATPKVVAAFAERREFDKILIYSKQVSNKIYSITSSIIFTLKFCCLMNYHCFILWLQVGYTPDYLFLLQTILRTDPQVSVVHSWYLQHTKLWKDFTEYMWRKHWKSYESTNLLNNLTWCYIEWRIFFPPY